MPKLMSLIMILSCAFAAGHETYLGYDEIKWTSNYPAHVDVLRTLADLRAESQLGTDTSSEFNSLKYKESIYLISKIRKTKMTYVFIHGLYGGASQFDHFFRNMKEMGSDANAILLTLPGHYEKGNVNQPVKNATQEEWIAAVENSLKIAKKMSNRVIIVGQSTGGLLATYSAMNFPSLVDGVILLEPALKVQSRIEIATCVGKNIVNEASSLSWIAKLIGMDAPKGISVSMGCEVAKLARKVIDRKLEPFLNGNSNSISEESIESAMKRLSEKINVPVLMVNNVGDHVVDADYNKQFIKVIKRSDYFEINLDGNTQHGENKTLSTDYNSNSFYKYTCIFLLKNFGEQNCSRSFFRNELYKYFQPIDNLTSDQDFAKILQDNLQNKDKTLKTGCTVLEKISGDISLCQKLKDSVSNFLNFWESEWAQYRNNSLGYKTFFNYVDRSYSHMSTIERENQRIRAAEYHLIRNLFYGVDYYDLNYVYNWVYSRYEEQIKIMETIKTERYWLEDQLKLARQKTPPPGNKGRISLEKHIQNSIHIEKFFSYHVYAVYSLIDASENLDQEIYHQEAYLVELQKLLFRIKAAQGNLVNDEEELSYIMSNFLDIPNQAKIRTYIASTVIKLVLDVINRE